MNIDERLPQAFRVLEDLRMPAETAASPTPAPATGDADDEGWTWDGVPGLTEFPPDAVTRRKGGRS